MNRSSNGLFRNYALILFFGGFLTSGNALQADSVIQDTFGIRDRIVGGALNGTGTEKGDAVWEATKNLVMGGKGNDGFIGAKDANGFTAKLPVISNAKTIIVEGELSPASAGDQPNWLAVGIGNPEMGSPPWGMGVYLIISSAGGYTVGYDPDVKDWASKSSVALKAGMVPDFDPDKPTKVKLEFDPASNALSAWVGENQILDHVNLADKSMTVDASFAGFSGFNQKPDSKIIENFSLEMSRVEAGN